MYINFATDGHSIKVRQKKSKSLTFCIRADLSHSVITKKITKLYRISHNSFKQKEAFLTAEFFILCRYTVLSPTAA